MGKASAAARTIPVKHGKAEAGKPSRGLSMGLKGLICGGLIALATPTALLLGALTAPGLVFLLVDRQPGQPTARAMLLFAGAASVFPVRDLWLTSHTISAALNALGAPTTLLIACGASATAWLASELAPVIAGAIAQAIIAAKTAALRKARDKLIAEWGEGAPSGQ